MTVAVEGVTVTCHALRPQVKRSRLPIAFEVV